MKHRVIVAEGQGGTLAAFPPPHQYLFPRDRTDNPRLVWFGAKHRSTDWPLGIGIGQDNTGGGSYVPWFNAPPGSVQRPSVFFLLSKSTAHETYERVLAYTHNDHFKPLPGFKTFTSHWHMAITVAAMEEARGKSLPKGAKDFVEMFHEMGVNMVHLGEFHGDGHQKDPGATRLAELEAEFTLCRKLSDDRTLFIPGEEVDEYLGLPAPGRENGHWMILFPKPVYWTMHRSKDQPFAETRSDGTLIYHIGSREDMSELVDREHALVWSSHPRIKASSWTPDIFHEEAFYKAPSWLGGAWKAMPADLSEPRLGKRVLDLLDDMSNWGDRKYAPGEVDVFKIDRTHELYGHMNVNYVQLEKTPKFDEGWELVLDKLRQGKFFVTTGEVLIPKCEIGGASPGSELVQSSETASRTLVSFEIDHTFPLAFAEVVSGDGKQVRRTRIDLSEFSHFGNRSLKKAVDLQGQTWARVEVWDVAANGAFSQPVWIKGQ